MRVIVLAAGVAACLGLAACEQSRSGATEAAVVAPKKSLTRSAQMYAGQEQILSVDAAAVEVGKSGLILTADGKTSMSGYTHPGFLPRINAVLPRDGIYEVDVVADRPAAAGAEAATPIVVKGEWGAYPASKLKGVRFVTKTNSVTAMLPPQG